MTAAEARPWAVGAPRESLARRLCGQGRMLGAGSHVRLGILRSTPRVGVGGGYFSEQVGQD